MWNVSQGSVQACEKLSKPMIHQLVEPPLAALSWSNHFLYGYQSLTSLQGNLGPFFFTTVLQFIEVRFSQVEVWTLTGSLQHLDSFFFSAILL